jgi:hypothetical protein
VNDIRLDCNILVKKLGGIGVVCRDSSYLCRSNEDDIRSFSIEKLAHRMLISQVKFRV